MSEELKPIEQPKPRTRGAELVEGARWNDYGDPRERWEENAKGATIIFGTHVTAKQAVLYEIWKKIVREKHRHKPDNLDDIEGYVEIARRLKQG